MRKHVRHGKKFDSDLSMALKRLSKRIAVKRIRLDSQKIVRESISA